MANERPVVSRPVIEKVRGLPSRVSLVWLLPLTAIVVAIYLLWQAYVDRGPLVRIRFDNAGGVEAGQTPVRRNDVDVGRVEAVRLADDLDSVIVEARMNPSVAPYLDTDTRFWIVNARFTTTEISGLGTLLSGAYIEVDWDAEESERQSEFVGLDEAPLTKRGTPGLRLTLNADEAGYIVVGSPVFLRQLEVGRVERRRLSADGRRVLFDIFIQAPHHKHVRAETRFYSVSGVEGQLNADGIRVRVESISAFFTGGIGFETTDQASQSPRVTRDSTSFKLYDSRAAARDSLFEDEDDERYRYLAIFDGSIKGLKVDAPIEYNGVRVGRVASVATVLPSAPGQGGHSKVVLQFQPSRFGMDDITPEAFDQVLSAFVAEGLRAQLANGNLLTGTLIVKLSDAPAAEPAKLALDREPYPELPTLPSNVEAVTADLEALVGNLAALPLPELVQNANAVLVEIGELMASSDVKALPKDLAASLAALRSTSVNVDRATAELPDMVQSLSRASSSAYDVLDGLSPDSEIYIELAAAARELRVAARSIAEFAEFLEENPNAVLTGR